MLENNDKGAVKKYLKAIKLQPKGVRGHYELAFIYEKEEKYELAAEAFSNSMKYANVSSECWSQAFV